MKKKLTENELLLARMKILECENKRLLEFIKKILNQNLNNYKDLLHGFIAEFRNGEEN